MPRLRLELDPETYERLIDAAVVEQRPLDYEAAVLLRRGLSLPIPQADAAAAEVANATTR